MSINFTDCNCLRNVGFQGFKSISELYENYNVPKQCGVYLILYNDITVPEFLEVGTGGHFKGKNPNVSLEVLRQNWINKSQVIYIGKAGGPGKKATLNSRIKQYLQFGQSRNIGHYGGRYIWQIANSCDLIICWKELVDEIPRNIESELILTFVSKFGKLPFANLSN